MPILILFGPTGAGKTFIGRLLEKEFGFYFYDGDIDLTEEMKQALHTMKPITDPMRDRFINNLINSVEKLSANHPRLCVAQTFIKDKYRLKLLKRLPQAKFILVSTGEKLRHQRRRDRADYPWDEAYVKTMDAIFETPLIPHAVITNENNGTINLKACLQQLLSQLS